MGAPTVTPGMPNRSGVYAIRNAINGKCYIGSGVNMMTRAAFHKMKLRSGKHHSVKLQRAWDKYGAEAWHFEPLLICAKDNLLFYEQRAIDVLDSVRNGYNILLTAGSRLGMHHSEETRRRMSIVHTGKVIPASAREKHRARKLGVPQPQHVREKIAATMRGRKLSPRALASVRARVPSVEQRQRISAALMGHSVSLETRARQSIARLAFLASRKK